mgnify:CR=1 FL=1
MRHQVARQSDLDPRVPDFLDALSQGRITIALARKGETQALVWPAAADAPLAFIAPLGEAPSIWYLEQLLDGMTGASDTQQ